MLKDLINYKVSVVIPVYNESLAICEILDRVLKANVLDASLEVIIVDDGSVDETVNLINQYLNENPEARSSLTLHRSVINHGKGAALRAGFKLASGDIIIIQDGDLEYNPKDYEKLLTPFLNENTEVVFGNRFYNGYPKGMKLLNLLANRILSITSSLLYRQKISDEATGYKVFRKSVLNKFDLTCRGFEFCPEFTSKVLKSKIKLIEVPISYNPRGILEGKKIKARDGFIALWWLIKIRLMPSVHFMPYLARIKKQKNNRHISL